MVKTNLATILLFILLALHCNNAVFGFSIFGFHLFGSRDGDDDDYSQMMVPSGVIAGANERFCMRLLSVLERDNSGQNVFMSPFSILVALTMALVGAGNRSSTYEQIHTALGFDRSHSIESITDNLQQLLHELNSQNQSTVKLANALMAKQGEPILPSYLSKLETHFYSELFKFGSDPKQVLALVNSWASNKTNGLIKKVLDEIQPDTVTILLNAIYFNGKWKIQFQTKDTSNRKFHVQADQSKLVPFMQVTERFKYAQFEDGQMVEIPYRDQNISMFVFLPKVRSQSLITAFKLDSLTSRVSKLWPTKLKLLMPKYKLETNYRLIPSLNQLKIVAPFSPTIADFSNINGQRSNIYVSKVIHKAVIKLSEEGTEAAAVTGITSGSICGNCRFWPRLLHVELNRPFVHFIRDNRNGIVLFAGIIKDVPV